MGLGTSVGVSSSLFHLSSLALDRLKFSHMYTTMGIVGIFIAARGAGLPISHILPVLTITITTTGLYILNDVFDLEIDRISHPERALPRGLISTRQATAAAVLLMAMGSAVAFWVNTTSGLFVGVIAIFGILYSAPPVRLRRFPVIPNAIIGLFVFLSFMAGTTFWGSQVTGELVLGGLLLWATFLCASNAKDLSDLEGDEGQGVKTLPLIFGEDQGFIITSMIVYSAFVFPIIFIILFDLNLIFIAPIIAFMLLEVYCLRRFWRIRETDEGMKWFGIGFAQFVAVQITLMIAALV